jgi:hypothetical protein
MAKTYFLGFTKDGTPVGRGSNRDDFTHAAVAADPAMRRGLPSFSTSADGAARNFGKYGTPEIVEVKVVTPAEYRQATGKN